MDLLWLSNCAKNLFQGIKKPQSAVSRRQKTSDRSRCQINCEFAALQKLILIGDNFLIMQIKPSDIKNLKHGFAMAVLLFELVICVSPDLDPDPI
jgi:hypothetical protein